MFFDLNLNSFCFLQEFKYAKNVRPTAYKFDNSPIYTEISKIL